MFWGGELSGVVRSAWCGTPTQSPRQLMRSEQEVIANSCIGHFSGFAKFELFSCRCQLERFLHASGRASVLAFVGINFEFIDQQSPCKRSGTCHSMLPESLVRAVAQQYLGPEEPASLTEWLFPLDSSAITERTSTATTASSGAIRFYCYPVLAANFVKNLRSPQTL